MKITTIGIDLAKIVFQIHGVDERGKVAVRKQLKHAEMSTVPDSGKHTTTHARLYHRTPTANSSTAPACSCSEGKIDERRLKLFQQITGH